MDGFKRRLSASIEFRLSWTLALAIALMALIAGTLSFMSALDEAHELQDDVLRQVAQLADRQHMLGPQDVVRTESLGLHAPSSEEDVHFVVMRLAKAGTTAAATSSATAPLALDAHLADGLHTVTSAGVTYRVLIRTLGSGDRTAVAQKTEFRDAIARDSALHAVMPLLVLMPVLLILVADLIRKMFRPISTLAQEIDARAEQDLRPIAEANLPQEVRPFVHALNRLFGRVDEAMQAQRRFVADAAHELRSPLTALSLQAEGLSTQALPEAAALRVAALQQGIGRSKKLIDQLLALARVQSTLPPDGPQQVSVQQVFRHALEDLMPLAEAKQIDIGLDTAHDAAVMASELDLITLVKNLVDNAIRYTPHGGRVDLSVMQSGGLTTLQVRDNGPGIAPSERERVFDAFYRTLGTSQTGSGLGLAIVRAIADRIGATVQLAAADPQTGQGLSVTVQMRARTLTPA